MRYKKFLSITAMVLVIITFMFQGSMSYAVRPTKPPTDPTEPPTQSSLIDITTADSAYVIDEDDTFSFDIKSTMKENLDVTWKVESDTFNQLTLMSEASSKSGKRNITYYETASFQFTPIDVTERQHYVIVIAAYNGDVYQDQVVITVDVNPVIITVPQKFSYVALGDSIPFGVSYEYVSLLELPILKYFTPTIESYSDKLNTYFKSMYTTNDVYTFNDLSVSGYNAVDLLNDLNGTDTDHSYVINLVADADVITLCIGANDIMDAAPEVSTGRDFYNIDWDVANAGRESFERDYPQIIELIRSFNPDVKLLVMTVYNPYDMDDKGPSVTDPVEYHALVENYLSGTESALGLNEIITNLDADYGETFDYSVVPVHDYFEKYYSNKKAGVTGFYNVLGGLIQDPHPDKNGQNIIYDLHYKVLNNILIE